jgi:ATP-dependent DNA helicase RecQ
VIHEGDYTVLVDAVREWPTPVAIDGVGPATARALSALRSAAERPAEVGAADLPVLIRAVLRADAVNTGQAKPITVPRGVDPWPERAGWEAHGFEIVSESDTRLRVAADAWLPGWLSADHDPTIRAVEPSPRDTSRLLVPADPFYEAATNRDAYKTTGQRDAIRWLSCAPPGATLIANLPTGSGKSTVGYFPALVPQRGTTIFVVPTTSLALDQERAFRELVVGTGRSNEFPRELAYVGDMPDETKGEVRRRISDGTQRIVFTSPESLSGGLSSALYRAAESGGLSALVIDEAHIVAQWGTEFRPEFQALAGIRDDLLLVCVEHGHPRFPTVLLSATMGQDTLDTLAGLFARPGPCGLVSSVSLRPEPEYWISVAASEPQREERVLEALRHLPRPAILYATRRKDADAWGEVLRQHGWRRVRVVSGDSSSMYRGQVMRAFRAGDVDVVVATSAFGLGVDQSDVRAVVHACVPETIDRWYQEVGRGGRDGKPCIAMLVAGPGDWGIARNLSTRRVISLETGRDRWTTMRARADLLPDGRWRIPLDAVRAQLDVDSPENRAWNVRTLLLLHRAGVIRLEAEPPPARREGEDEVEWQARLEEAFAQYERRAVVRILKPIEDDATWETDVASARQATRQADQEAFRALTDVLERGAAACERLAGYYTIRRAVPGVETELPVRVAPSCGGCPVCRARGTSPRDLVAPESQATIGGTHRTWGTTYLHDITADVPLVVVADSPKPAEFERLIRRLADRGLGRLDLGDDYVPTRRVHRLLATSRVVVEPSWDPFTTIQLPSLLLRVSTSPDRHDLDAGGVARIVVVARDRRDPRHPTQSIGDYHQNVTSMDALFARI